MQRHGAEPAAADEMLPWFELRTREALEVARPAAKCGYVAWVAHAQGFEACTQLVAATAQLGCPEIPKPSLLQ